MVPQDDVLGFAVYTVAHGTLKITAQLFPLLPDQSREVVLEVRPVGNAAWRKDAFEKAWRKDAFEKVLYTGWSAHFGVKDWDTTQDFDYRLSHGEKATFDGLITQAPYRQRNDCGGVTVG